VRGWMGWQKSSGDDGEALRQTWFPCTSATGEKCRHWQMRLSRMRRVRTKSRYVPCRRQVHIRRVHRHEQTAQSWHYQRLRRRSMVSYVSDRDTSDYLSGGNSDTLLAVSRLLKRMITTSNSIIYLRTDQISTRPWPGALVYAKLGVRACVMYPAAHSPKSPRTDGPIESKRT